MMAFIGGGSAQHTLSDGKKTDVTGTVITSVMMDIHSGGGIGGAHVNPSISIAMIFDIFLTPKMRLFHCLRQLGWLTCNDKQCELSMGCSRLVRGGTKEHSVGQLEATCRCHTASWRVETPPNKGSTEDRGGLAWQSCLKSQCREDKTSVDGVDMLFQ
ncbi:hypothetical protein Ae201684P_014153 [Aphanomyces euteiches]|uniref:Aquaporin n=1 Tax=Aphanomyces euteiches TaxID=100861 RepID=A0A6G0WYE0_9STRA|nr:hypothetical protein Ae201684_010281 [Aphanomyces euteiches]KAH9090347.1 hypothetical protein Ae201684P_014153 [Aphanomyces euteiches]